MEPSHFTNMEMKILQYDDSVINAMSEADLTTYKDTGSNYTAMPFKVKLDPMNGWAIPFVTNHKYRAHWDNGQLDFTRMRIEVSQRWQEADEHILFNFPFVDDREAVDFFGVYGGSYTDEKDTDLYYPNGSLTNNAPTVRLSGYNTVDNETKKEIDFVINGKAASSKTLEVDGIRCRDGTSSWCTTAPVIVECTGEQKLWSEAASWAIAEGEASSVPKEGESAVVPSGVIMIFDLEESPILELLTINGCLQFLSDNSKD